MFQKTTVNLCTEHISSLEADVTKGTFDSVSQALRYVLDKHYKLAKKGRQRQSRGRPRLSAPEAAAQEESGS